MKLTHPIKNRTNGARNRAFTLVELLLVLTILAILAGIVLPKMTGRTQQARITRAQSMDVLSSQANLWWTTAFIPRAGPACKP